MSELKLICPFGHKSYRGEHVCHVCGAQLVVERRGAERYWQGGFDNIYLDRHPTV